MADLQQRVRRRTLQDRGRVQRGANQAKLWARLAPGAGHDAFFASISFAETRRYVAQVLADYDRYREWPPDGRARASGARAR